MKEIVLVATDSRIDRLEALVDGLRGELQGFRTDVNARFAEVNARLTSLEGRITTMWITTMAMIAAGVIVLIVERLVTG